MQPPAHGQPLISSPSLPIIGHRPDPSRPACRAAIVYAACQFPRIGVSGRLQRGRPRVSQLRTIATRAELALTLHRLTWIAGGTP